MATVTKAEAVIALQVVKADLEALESGSWVPDPDSVWAVLNQLAQVQAFLEAPCDS